jgi:PleD family two-component response regulator
LGNRIRSLIQDSYLVRGDQRLQVMVSIGGTLAQPDDAPDTLIKRADTLLYTGKQDGRNRLTME